MHPATTPFLVVGALAQRLNENYSDFDALLGMTRGRACCAGCSPE